MAKSIFEFVTAKAQTAVWNMNVKDRAPYLGETIFPNKKKLGLDLKWIKGSKGLPVVLDPSAFDVPAKLGTRIKFDEVSAQMPFFKKSKSINEETRQLLNMALETNNDAYITSLTEMVFDDNMSLLEGASAQRERMRMMALTTGVVAIEANGQNYNFDYKIPAGHIKTAGASWATTTTDIIKDILDWQQVIEDDTGTKPTRAVCNRKTFSYIMANEGVRKSIYPANNGIGLITEAVIKDFIFQATGIDVVIYTKKYIDEAGVTKQYIADDTFVMFPEGSLGNTWFGTTPEESDLRTSKVANVDITDTGVAVTTIQKADPVTVETKVSMICLPSFERADQVLIADVTP